MRRCEARSGEKTYSMMRRASERTVHAHLLRVSILFLHVSLLFHSAFILISHVNLFTHDLHKASHTVRILHSGLNS